MFWSFSGADPTTSQRWAGGEGFGVCLCSPLWGLCWGAVEGLRSSARRRGTQPELSQNRGAQENTGPPKQNTFYGNGSIYLRGSQRTAAQRLFNGKQGDCGGPPEDLHERRPTQAEIPNFFKMGGELTASFRPLVNSDDFDAIRESALERQPLRSEIICPMSERQKRQAAPHPAGSPGGLNEADQVRQMQINSAD